MNIKLRKQPYPYQAMLAVCSDLDETPDAKTYFELSKFLNTSSTTSLGNGVGLEVGNTIYFRMPENQFSFFNCTNKDRADVLRLIESGHIDCLHSFGDDVNSRAEIKAIWKQLPKNKIKVWIDHARAPSNFDNDIMFGEGATNDAICYHADLAVQNGIEFVWKGRVTSVIAQDSRVSLTGIFTFAHPVASIKTLLKEIVKIAIATLGSDKYAMHKHNKLTRKTKLDSGQGVTEFIRSNPSWGGVSHYETADGISQVLTSPYLEHLCHKRGNSILYTHLGKTTSDSVLPPDAIRAFQLLAEYNNSKKVLVTTTRRLLEYNRALKNLRWTASQDNEVATIHLETESELTQLQGLSWLVPSEIKEAILITHEGKTLRLNIDTMSSKTTNCLSIPWQRLDYPIFDPPSFGTRGP